MKGTYFVTGTDTEIGKTYASSFLLKKYARLGWKTLGLKPIASGAVDGQSEDALALKAASSIDLPLDMVNPFCFAPPIAPHIAAREAGIEISSQGLLEGLAPSLSITADLCLIEGAGGFCVPINETEMWEDVVRAFDIPVILVVGMRLGCLNHAMLSERAIIGAGLTYKGWVANQLSPNMDSYQENLQTLKAKLHSPLLEEVPYGG